MNKYNLNKLLKIKTDETLFLNDLMGNAYNLTLDKKQFKQFLKLYSKLGNNFYMITGDNQSRFDLKIERFNYELNETIFKIDNVIDL